VQTFLIGSRLLQRKFSEIDTNLNKQLEKLSVAQLEELVEVALDFKEIDDLTVWLKRMNKS
jgi:hypothetical protein